MFADVCHCFFVPKTCFRNMDSSRPKSSCTSILTYLGICPWTDCGQFLELHKKRTTQYMYIMYMEESVICVMKPAR